MPGHCNLRGNELADLEANLGFEVAQPSVPLDSSTRAALIRREERQSSLTHPRLTALYTTRPREEEEALLQKADRTDLIRFRCGHHPQLRRWQHMTGMSETDSCRLCAEEEESSEHNGSDALPSSRSVNASARGGPLMSSCASNAAENHLQAPAVTQQQQQQLTLPRYSACGVDLNPSDV